jgi:hypothetical protein
LSTTGISHLGGAIARTQVIGGLGVFDSLGLSKPAQYFYLVWLVFAFGIALYWTMTNTGLSQPLIWLQSKIFFGRYFGVLTVFLSALPIALGGQVLAHVLDAMLKTHGRK